MVAGLAFCLLLSPATVVLAQTVPVLPIVIVLIRQTVEILWGRYRRNLTSLGLRNDFGDACLARLKALGPSGYAVMMLPNAIKDLSFVTKPGAAQVQHQQDRHTFTPPIALHAQRTHPNHARTPA